MAKEVIKDLRTTRCIQIPVPEVNYLDICYDRVSSYIASGVLVTANQPMAIAKSIASMNNREDIFDALVLLSRGIKPSTIMNAWKQGFSLSPTLWRGFTKVSKMQNELEEFDMAVDVVEGIDRCGKCGSNRLIHRTMQVRSSDEGDTSFFTCTQCKNAWKVNN